MKQMGYLMVDHRASPGLPEDVARWAGYDPKLAREGKVFEADTMTCCECHNWVVKNPERTRERHSCSCGNYLCDGCAFRLSLPDQVHKPLARVIDEVKKQEALGSPSLLFPTS
jgi:hypothetical protein